MPTYTAVNGDELMPIQAVLPSKKSGTQKFVCIGYECVCGNRVEVLRWAENDDSVSTLPSEVTVCCREGHVATITADLFEVMEEWDVDGE